MKHEHHRRGDGYADAIRETPAWRAGYEQGKREERARCVAILAHPAALTRPAVALACITTGVSPEQAATVFAIVARDAATAAPGDKTATARAIADAFARTTGAIGHA